MNRPKLVRSPNETIPIRQPATMTTVGRAPQRAAMAGGTATTSGSIIEPSRARFGARCRSAATTPARRCSLARTLEVVGERWTLLIVRDLFFGVRRFSDLQRAPRHPARGARARGSTALVEAGMVERRPYPAATSELTARGHELWPAVHALMQWGERHCAARRAAARVRATPTAAPTSTPAAAAPPAGSSPGADELVMRPGPGRGRRCATTP